jgi:hypothetical protein
MDHAFLVYDRDSAGIASSEPGGATSSVLEPLMELFSARRRAS